MSVDRAAAGAGFNPKTYYDWKNRATEDPEGNPDEVAFMAACSKAEAGGVEGLFDLAHEHAKKDPAMVRYLLGLKGHTIKKEVELAGPGGGPVAISFDFSKTSDADLADLVDEFRDD